MCLGASRRRLSTGVEKDLGRAQIGQLRRLGRRFGAGHRPRATPHQVSSAETPTDSAWGARALVRVGRRIGETMAEVAVVSGGVRSGPRCWLWAGWRCVLLALQSQRRRRRRWRPQLALRRRSSIRSSDDGRGPATTSDAPADGGRPIQLIAARSGRSAAQWLRRNTEISTKTVVRPEGRLVRGESRSVGNWPWWPPTPGRANERGYDAPRSLHQIGC